MGNKLPQLSKKQCPNMNLLILLLFAEISTKEKITLQNKGISY
jgi:hypothetical protein